jgi:tellurite resistance protein TehA-like permease
MAIAHSIDKFQRSAVSLFGGAVPADCFAFVMATGIVSIAAGLQGLGPIAAILFAINLIAFPVLAVLALSRLFCYPAAFIDELSRHRTAAGFLTIVAAVAVLGDEFAVQTAYQRVAVDLWLADCGLWVALVYAFFALLTTRPAKPSLSSGLDGTWLLIVVATEAVAILGTHVADGFVRHDIVVYLSLCWFLLGGFFYLIIIALIAYRWLFEPLPAEELTSPYWINMGAVAIATLAGARLESIAGVEPLLTGLLPAIAVATVLFWTVATWWIPLLIGLMIWHHAVQGVRITYQAGYWSMVFPFGMYTAATWTFAHVNGFDFLFWIPRVSVWAAILAWVAGFTGMVHRGTAPL